MHWSNGKRKTRAQANFLFRPNRFSCQFVLNQFYFSCGVKTITLASHQRNTKRNKQRRITNTDFVVVVGVVVCVCALCAQVPCWKAIKGSICIIILTTFSGFKRLRTTKSTNINLYIRRILWCFFRILFLNFLYATSRKLW